MLTTYFYESGILLRISKMGLEHSDNLMVWYASFKSSADKHSQLEFPKIAEVSLINRKAKFTLCNLLFNILFEILLAMSIMNDGYECGDMFCFRMPECPNLCILFL